MSKEKLREEIVAPYKQNWIGILSVCIVVLSAITTNFPELLQTPLIPIPDLWLLSDKMIDLLWYVWVWDHYIACDKELERKTRSKEP